LDINEKVDRPLYECVIQL